MSAALGASSSPSSANKSSMPSSCTWRRVGGWEVWRGGNNGSRDRLSVPAAAHPPCCLPPTEAPQPSAAAGSGGGTHILLLVLVVVHLCDVIDEGRGAQALAPSPALVLILQRTSESVAGVGMSDQWGCAAAERAQCLPAASPSPPFHPAAIRKHPGPTPHPTSSSTSRRLFFFFFLAAAAADAGSLAAAAAAAGFTAESFFLCLPTSSSSSSSSSCTHGGELVVGSSVQRKRLAAERVAAAAAGRRTPPSGPSAPALDVQSGPLALLLESQSPDRAMAVRWR